MTWKSKRTAKEAYALFAKWVDKKGSAAPNPWCPKDVAGCALGYSYFAGLPRRQWQWNVDNFVAAAKKNKSFSKSHGDFGDAVFFDWSGQKTGWDHIGFVIKVTSKNVKHISANSGGGLVRINTTPLKYVSGFGKPVKWAAEVAPVSATPVVAPVPAKPVTPVEAVSVSYVNSLKNAGYKVSSGKSMEGSWAEHRARGSLGGIDWAVGVGSKIIAPTNGRVENIPNNGTGGNTVTFWHEDGGLGKGWRDQFMHLSKFVKPGHYKAGDVIGYSGGAKGAPGSGSSTGPHIHWHLIDPKGRRVPPYDHFTSAPVKPATTPVKTVAELADAVLRGEYGNGPARKKALRARYDEVQAEVNRRLSGKTAVKAVAAPSAPVEAATPVVAVTPAVEVKVPVQAAQPPVEASPVITPKKEEPIVTKKLSAEEQAALIASQPAGNIGVIIPTAKGRKIAYAAYSGVSLIATNAAVGFAAVGADFPAWLVVSLAVIGNLATPFAALAIANASNGEKK
ncbi:MAG: peptidoglycan DD-metalloendopeptidase family protein [Betaproteobacteria bacterium]